MRLIDADGLTMNCKVHLSESDARILEDALNRMLNDAPTVDAEPVRHGRWTENEWYPFGIWECSACNNAEHIKSFYCPSCGAKMDEPMEVIDDDEIR